jgi:hypothetical protein
MIFTKLRVALDYNIIYDLWSVYSHMIIKLRVALIRLSTQF